MGKHEISRGMCGHVVSHPRDQRGVCDSCHRREVREYETAFLAQRGEAFDAGWIEQEYARWGPVIAD